MPHRHFSTMQSDMILTSSSHDSSKWTEPVMKPKEEPPDCNFKTTNEGLSIRPTTTCITFSPHIENSSKLNQSNQSFSEEVMQLSIQVNSSLCDSDMRVFKGGSRTNQKESSYEPNFSGILIHHRSSYNWIHLKTGPDVKDMNFTNRWFCFSTCCATEPKIESHRPDQVQSRYETNWSVFLDLLAFQQAQEQRKISTDQKDTAQFPKWVNLVHYLKIARPNWIGSLQTYVWHPGYISTSP